MDDRTGKSPATLYHYSTGHGDLAMGRRCLIMGIVNVTPDSFSDGGQFNSTLAAANHAIQLIDDGADVLDIGGESTRPGAEPVCAAEQIERVAPVIAAIRQQRRDVPISVDTRSAEVAAAALEAGADIVNDVSGMRDDADMPALLAQTGVPFIVMHMQGTPATMQAAPQYGDVVAEVSEFFEARADELAAAGVTVEGRMIVDPGVGFGKTFEHNLALLRSAARLSRRFPVLVGASRKRFLGEILNEPDPTRRVFGTAATVAQAALTGVHLVRVHDVKAMRQVADVMAAIYGQGD